MLLLVVSLLIGVGLQRVKNLPNNAHSTLGTLILYVPMPAICLLSLPQMDWNLSLLSVTLVAWIAFGASYFFISFLGKRFGWSKDLVGCLILTTGLSNTSFVGFPVISALYGAEGLKTAIVLDQMGSFLIVSSIGVWIAVTFSSGHMKKRILFKRILVFPPFIAFLVGTFGGLLGWRPDETTRAVLQPLANLLTPMALISVGLQLKWNDIHQELKYLLTGLSFKLIFAPLIILVIYYFLGADKKVLQVIVMESAMAPMITGSILAASHNLRPRLAGMMVGVGVPVSVITLSLWYFLLETL